MTRLYTTQPVPVISISDMAIDDAATGDALRLYAETRDPEMLGGNGAVKFHAGMQPCIFLINRIYTSQVAKIERTSPVDEERNKIAFMCGVLAVDRFHGCDDQPHTDWRPGYITDPQPKQVKIMSEAELDLFPSDVAEEIGSVILQRAPLVRGRPVCFVAPLSCAVALGKRYRASLRSADILSRGTTPSGGTAPSQPGTASTSGSAGDAPATASAI